jgi:hypothetical protein
MARQVRRIVRHMRQPAAKQLQRTNIWRKA